MTRFLFALGAIGAAVLLLASPAGVLACPEELADGSDGDGLSTASADAGSAGLFPMVRRPGCGSGFRQNSFEAVLQSQGLSRPPPESFR